jgi:hypothetical protein
MGNVFLYIFCLYCTITLIPYDLRPCDAHALISRYLDGFLARVLWGVKGEAAQPKEATITLIPYNLNPCDVRWNHGVI